MRYVLVIALGCALAGCGSNAKKLAFNRYTIQAPYGGDIPYEQAVARLTRESESLCDRGYRKIHDFDTVKGSKRILIWEVTCEGVERSDAGQGTLKP